MLIKNYKKKKKRKKKKKTLSLPNFWGNILLSAKYILGNVTTESQAV